MPSIEELYLNLDAFDRGEITYEELERRYGITGERMKVDREKLRHKARISISTGKAVGSTENVCHAIVLTYAGRSVSEKLPSSPASLASTIERMLDQLAAHVEGEVNAIESTFTVTIRNLTTAPP